MKLIKSDFFIEKSFNSIDDKRINHISVKKLVIFNINY
jgi:hypothetical protein